MNNEITKAKAAYKKTDTKGKKLLSDIFGEKIFSQTWIELFNDFCKEKKIDQKKPENSLRYKNPLPGYQEAENAIKMMMIICQWYQKNKKWVPNWNNTSEPKWFPRFEMHAGFRFNGSYYVSTHTHTGGGSRLCFKTEEDSNEAGQKFEPIYEKFLTL